MNTVVWRKELTEFLRDRRLLVMTVVLLLLLMAAALDGWNRAAADARARAAAVVTDRELWTEQGENNPHGAAHFARYAFRDTPALAAFDPGVFDYAGAAFWMEAHTQNPTTLRRAEDTAVRAPFAALSPAWVVQVVGTLVLALALFNAIAGERERGTLRGLAAAGVPARSFAVGKIGAVGSLVALMTLLVIVAAVVPALGAGQTGPALARVMALLLVYLLALLAFALMITWISAALKTTSQAFNAAALLWLSLALLCPVLAGQLATTLYPDIQEQELKNDIQLKAQSPFWSGDAQAPAVAALEARVLTEFAADSWESLGFDREGLILQAHEEFANDIYDELYGALNARHARQDAVLRYASLLSPVLALQRLSSAIAGTDLLAQQRFAEQAEQHRRLIIRQLNRDMMMNAGDQGFAYTADRALWESTPDFKAIPPSLAELFRHYRFEFIVLLLWLGVAGSQAMRATRQSLSRGA